MIQQSHNWYISKGLEIRVWIDTRPSVFIAAFFKTVIGWENPQMSI